MGSDSGRVQDYVYVFQQGEHIETRGGGPKEPLTIVPTGLQPITITVVAALSLNDYAIRTWTFDINQKVKPTLVDIPEKDIRLAGVRSTYQLAPLAYLDAPASGVVNVASAATYSVLRGGQDVVSVSADGLVTALKRGSAVVKVKFRKHSDTVAVLVER